jgi:hypothetical protein
MTNSELIDEIIRLSGPSIGSTDASRPLLEAMNFGELYVIRDALQELVDEGRKTLDAMTPENRAEFLQLLNHTSDSLLNAKTKLDEIQARIKERKENVSDI